MFTPEEIELIQTQIDAHKLAIEGYQTALRTETNANAKKVLTGSLSYSLKQVEACTKQLADNQLAEEQAARNRQQEAERAEKLEVERARQEALRIERERREREAAEQARRDEEERQERARMAAEQKLLNEESRKRQAAEAIAMTVQKAAEEEAKREKASRRYVLDGGKGPSQKYALRVNAGDDEQFDILVEVRPVVK